MPGGRCGPVQVDYRGTASMLTPQHDVDRANNDANNNDANNDDANNDDAPTDHHWAHAALRYPWADGAASLG